MALGSYDDTLATDKDWVRFTIGDRTGPNYRLSDEEILALLDGNANKYFAAAEALDGVLAGWGVASKGIKSKKVDELTITYESPAALKEKILTLRRRGATALQGAPKHFRILT